MNFFVPNLHILGAYMNFQLTALYALIIKTYLCVKPLSIHVSFDSPIGTRRVHFSFSDYFFFCLDWSPSSSLLFSYD